MLASNVFFTSATNASSGSLCPIQRLQLELLCVSCMSCSFPSLGSFVLLHIWVVFPRTGKMSKICHNFFSLELYCDQTVLFFQVFSIVLKSFCPLQSKNTFVLVLALFFLFLKKYFFCPKIKFFGQIYCIFNVLVRPNLQRWTGFDLLII